MKFLRRVRLFVAERGAHMSRRWSSRAPRDPHHRAFKSTAHVGRERPEGPWRSRREGNPRSSSREGRGSTPPRAPRRSASSTNASPSKRAPVRREPLAERTARVSVDTLPGVPSRMSSPPVAAASSRGEDHPPPASTSHREADATARCRPPRRTAARTKRGGEHQHAGGRARPPTRWGSSRSTSPARSTTPTPPG